ncbi:MAG: hypothetical protein LLG14_15725 [Nocardiaceae bacterium]|nr:hypothetical protein [Nocardiaceae bacterium]
MGDMWTLFQVATGLFLVGCLIAWVRTFRRQTNPGLPWEPRPPAREKWHFTPPPGWPPMPPGWVPPYGWIPDPAWPPAPPGWRWWVHDDPNLRY